MFRAHVSTLLLTIMVSLFTLSSCSAGNKEPMDGDIIFQSTSGGQGRAIQIATRSKYSHCGIIFIKDGKPYVYEAVQPVKITPLNKFIARGDDGHYVIKRLKDADKVLTPQALKNMKVESEKFIGKDYDIYFGWKDNEIYCSELVWKVYKRGAGTEIGTLQKLRSFDLSHDIVKMKLTERYGNNIPYDETVISPASIFESNKLITVDGN